MKFNEDKFCEAFAYAESKIDYDIIREVMTQLNWTWDGVGVPTTTLMRSTVMSLFSSLLKSEPTKSTTCATGGFYVNYWVWDHSEEIEVGFSLDKFSTTIN